jgi:hypothetical protein
MPREPARQKADRLLVEGRVVVVAVGPHAVHARIRGDGHIYEASWTSTRRWSCTCRARTDACSHLYALRRIVAVDIEQDASA